MHRTAAPRKHAAAVAPPNIIGRRDGSAEPAKLKIPITTAVKAVAAAINMPDNPEALASAAVAILNRPSRCTVPSRTISLRKSGLIFEKSMVSPLLESKFRLGDTGGASTLPAATFDIFSG